MQTKPQTTATEETHQIADRTEVEVKQTESPTKATEDLSLLYKTYQSADCRELEVKQTESGPLLETLQNADCTELEVK